MLTEQAQTRRELLEKAGNLFLAEKEGGISPDFLIKELDELLEIDSSLGDDHPQFEVSWLGFVRLTVRKEDLPLRKPPPGAIARGRKN